MSSQLLDILPLGCSRCWVVTWIVPGSGGVTSGHVAAGAWESKDTMGRGILPRVIGRRVVEGKLCGSKIDVSFNRRFQPVRS